MSTQQLPKPGQRIELVRMADIHPIPVGTRGTVLSVDQWAASKNAYNVYVAWDNGSTLALLTDVDQWRVLSCEAPNT